MTDFTLRTAERRLPGGRKLRLGLYSDEQGVPLIAVLAIGFDSDGLADVVDPCEEDRLVLPAAALDTLAGLLKEIREAAT